MDKIWGGPDRIRSTAAGQECDAFLERAKIDTEPVLPEHAQEARRAWRRFRKGNHPAALNYGDCFAYALARTTGEPLLFKGEDFARTDIEAASSLSRAAPATPAPAPEPPGTEA